MFDKLKDFIDEHLGEAIDAGSPTEAPSAAALSSAEKIIGAKLPPSYCWFVKNYGGASIHGEEIYSVIEDPLPGIYQGDIAALTIRLRTEGIIPDTDIALCSTNFGEEYSMDASQPDDAGEYKVYRKAASKRSEFAKDFGDFIIKFTNDSTGPS